VGKSHKKAAAPAENKNNIKNGKKKGGISGCDGPPGRGPANFKLTRKMDHQSWEHDLTKKKKPPKGGAKLGTWRRGTRQQTQLGGTGITTKRTHLCLDKIPTKGRSWRDRKMNLTAARLTSPRNVKKAATKGDSKE